MVEKSSRLEFEDGLPLDQKEHFDRLKQALLLIPPVNNFVFWLDPEGRAGHTNMLAFAYQLLQQTNHMQHIQHIKVKAGVSAYFATILAFSEHLVRLTTYECCFKNYGEPELIE